MADGDIKMVVIDAEGLKKAIDLIEASDDPNIKSQAVLMRKIIMSQELMALYLADEGLIEDFSNYAKKAMALSKRKEA